MRDKKILVSLKSLSVYDRNSFSKFVHSPYFNVNEHLTLYFKVLEEYIKKEEDVPDNEVLWKTVYGNEPYQNQKFLKLNSDLVRLLEEFLSQKEFDQAKSMKLNLKLEGARKRNLEKLYNGILGEIERLDKNEINQSSEFYLSKYQIEKNVFSLKSENEKKIEKFEITSELNIKKISDNLDYFYIAEKLRQYCTLLSWKKMYKLDIEMLNMENVLQLAQEEPYCSIPPIQLYYKMHLTYTDEENESHYFQLRSLIGKYIHLFPQDEQREIYSTILSYCINKTNKNYTEFHRETFNIYSEGIENKILYNNNDLSVTTFRNISIAALRVEEFTWAENFIYNYANFVDEKNRKNAVEFSLARLEFYRGNYAKVIYYLNRVNFDDVWYNINAKSLYLIVYYELEEFDALESLLQSFKMFIKREKSLTEIRKAHYLNLIKFTNTLIKIHYRDKNKLTKLKEEIVGTKGIVSKPWLLEKVDAMLKK